jgi:glycosyltransferase involved in cell wall biosynthesis
MGAFKKACITNPFKTIIVYTVSEQKSVIIIGPAHPLRGGLASYNERLARQFMQEGHQVSIYTFSLQYPGFLFPGTTQYSTEPAPADLNIKVCINSVNPINWISIGNQLKKLRPDIIVVRYWLPFMGPCLGTILRMVKKNKHTKVVCIADNIIPHEKRPGDVPFTRYFVKPVDAFISMSEKVLADLPLFAPGKPAQLVAHPLYDNFGEKISQTVARQKLGIAADENIVLFFGFIRRYKGLDILLDAIKILQAENYTNFKLLVAGEFYEDRKAYDEQIAKLGIQQQLILKTDFIPDSEVKHYLCAADVVVQPYRSATQSGVTPLAYHFEVPMIVTNVGGLPALVPDGKVGLIAEPVAADIANKIKQFFKTGALSFLPQLVQEKTKYSWSKMTSTIFQVADLN